MKVVTLCLGFVVAAAAAAGSAAQDKPNLSGEWISVDSQQHTQELIIKHDASTLSLEGKPEVPKRTFKLDGSDTEMSSPDGKPLLAKAAWLGNALVIRIHFPETAQDIRRVTLSINADGQLVMETAVIGGKPQPPTREVFKRH